MRAVVTVIGKDKVGILAQISAVCAECNVNINDVNQSVMQDLFTMVMLCDIREMNVSFKELSDKLSQKGNELGLSIHVTHEDIFNSMHRI